MIDPAEENAGKIKSILFSELSRLEGESAIAYSGGLDSTILMAAAGFKLAAFTVGAQDSRDFVNTRDASNMMGFRVNFVPIGREDIQRHKQLLTEIDPDITRGELGYEIVLSIVLENVPHDTLVTGQGADELFYGYRRFIDDPSLDNTQHLEKLFHRTLLREKKLADHYGKRLVTPYLNEEIVRIAESTEREGHIRGNENKILLRQVASLLDLPDSIIHRPKKAAQYGSGVSRILATSW